MTDENQDEGLIRRYLLGRLSQDEREQLEERIMVDTELFNQVLLAEDELIEEYVQGDLTESDRTEFEASFLSTPQGRQRLSYAEAVQRYLADTSWTISKEVGAGKEAVSEGTETPAAPLEARPWAGQVIRPVWWRRPASIAYLSAAALIVIALTVGIWWGLFRESEVNKGLKALAYAYRDQRPLEARISGFNYAPVASTRGSEQQVDQVSRNRAERILLDAEFEHPDASSHHALGRLYLAERKFDEAIQQFEEALRSNPNNAQLHSDYGAALLELGKANRPVKESGKGLETLGRSLEELTKAIELDGSLLEARFNRALCRQFMMLDTQAEDDWNRYLERDSTSKWADEAKQNLKRLSEQRSRRVQNNNDDCMRDFLDAYRQGDNERAWTILTQNREAVSGRSVFFQLVTSYLNPSLIPDQRNSQLQVMYYVARLELERGNDRSFSDLVKVYGSATPRQRNLLFQAQGLMRAAYDQYRTSKFDDAVVSYLSARDAFSQAGDNLDAGLANCCLGRCFAETARPHESLAILQPLVRTFKDRKHYWLLAQALNAIGSAHAVLNEYSAAIESTSSAFEVSEKVHDSYSAQKNLAQRAVEYKNLGNYVEALTSIHRSLTLASDTGSTSRQMWRTYDTAARIFSSMSAYRVAADYGNEALQIASDGEDPSLMYVSLVHLGLVYGKLQSYSEAIKYARRGLEVADALPSEPGKLDMLAYSSLQLGNLNRWAGAFDSAVSYYDRAIQLNQELKSTVDLYEAHKGRLQCYIGQENYSLARADVATTLNLFEEHRSKIEEESNRNAFSEDQQSIYDVVIGFESAMNSPRTAFEYSEASRARSLLGLATGKKQLTDHNGVPDLVSLSNPRPLTLSQIQDHIPDQAQVIEYTALDDRVLMWVVTKTNFSFAEHRISSDELRARVVSFVRLLSQPSDNGRDEMRHEATELYRALIAPVQSVLDPRKLLCVVPDKILNHLPFNALVSPSGNYLISDYAVVLCPSSTMFLTCSDSASKMNSKGPERILSVGNPRFDASAFSSLAALPSSSTEAKTVASCYSERCVLVEGDAMADRVKSEMGKSSVIHLASHYVVDERSPMLSKLILAKETRKSANQNSEDGVLQVADIFGLDLKQTRLVVLSACKTGVERYYDGEGMMGMSRAFIAAGVPLVVASLWAVDSDASTELMIGFHQHRTHGGLSTVEGLRQAQLEMATGAEPRYQHPYYWASFMAIGGYATF